MFRRLVFENSAALVTLVAFITAASIYVMFAWRALRMKRPQVAHFENLPFEAATPESVGLPFVEQPRRGDPIVAGPAKQRSLRLRLSERSDVGRAQPPGGPTTIRPQAACPEVRPYHNSH
jgi:hypothetical protein